MDCRSFRKHHLAYLDNTLPGDLLVSAECHVIECEPCARHDTAVRRSLLLARNLAPIEPSADFAARLEARLRVECPGGRPVTVPYGAQRGDLARAAVLQRAFSGRTRTAALAASLLIAGYVAGSAFEADAEPIEGRHTPVIATLPEPEPAAALVASDFVTPAATGVSVWPGALLVDQLPTQLIGSQLQFTSYGR